MDTLSLPTEKVVRLSACRGRPPFSHSLLTMEPEASQRRSVELRSSIRTAAGPRMTAPAIDAGATIQATTQTQREEGKRDAIFVEHNQSVFCLNTQEK